MDQVEVNKYLFQPVRVILTKNVYEGWLVIYNKQYHILPFNSYEKKVFRSKDVKEIKILEVKKTEILAVHNKIDYKIGNAFANLIEESYEQYEKTIL